MFTPDALPAPLMALLGQVRSWSGDDAREQLRVSGPEDRAAWVAGLQQLADAVATASLTAVEVFDAAGDGQVLHGAASTTAWLRGATNRQVHEGGWQLSLTDPSRGSNGPVLFRGPRSQHLISNPRGP